MTYVKLYVLEKLCLFGNVFSGIIAFNIWRIPEKSLINKMFLVYFALDCVIGASDPFFLFKLFRERLGLNVEGSWHLIKLIIFFVRENGELQQEQNCIFYLATWMLWAAQRGIYNTVIMLIR